VLSLKYEGVGEPGVVELAVLESTVESFFCDHSDWMDYGRKILFDDQEPF
jgi:hypothetical protein